MRSLVAATPPAAGDVSPWNRTRIVRMPDRSWSQCDGMLCCDPGNNHVGWKQSTMRVAWKGMGDALSFGVRCIHNPSAVHRGCSAQGSLVVSDYHLGTGLLTGYIECYWTIARLLPDRE